MFHHWAHGFDYELPTFCCSIGQVGLASNDVPEILFDLFSSHLEEAKQFQKHIRAYKSIFSFTSFRTKLDKDLVSQKNGVYTCKAQG